MKWTTTDSGDMFSTDGKWLIRKGPTTVKDHPYHLVALTPTLILCRSVHWPYIVCKTLDEAQALAERQPKTTP